MSHILKRLNKEEKELQKIYSNCRLIRYEKCDYNYFNTYDNYKIEIYTDYKLFRIEFNNYYPFRAPVMYINDKNYLDSLIIKMPELKDRCLCCESLLCNLNWSPKKRVIDLLNEYYKNKKIIRNLIYQRFLNTICLKYEIPQELKEIIISHL